MQTTSVCALHGHHIYTLCLSHTQWHGRNYEQQLKVPVFLRSRHIGRGLGEVRFSCHHHLGAHPEYGTIAIDHPVFAN
jgi:hypothetical protein